MPGSCFALGASTFRRVAAVSVAAAATDSNLINRVN